MFSYIVFPDVFAWWRDQKGGSKENCPIGRHKINKLRTPTTNLHPQMKPPGIFLAGLGRPRARVRVRVVRTNGCYLGEDLLVLSFKSRFEQLLSQTQPILWFRAFLGYNRTRASSALSVRRVKCIPPYLGLLGEFPRREPENLHLSKH